MGKGKTNLGGHALEVVTRSLECLLLRDLIARDVIDDNVLLHDRVMAWNVESILVTTELLHVKSDANESLADLNELVEIVLGGEHPLLLRGEAVLAILKSVKEGNWTGEAGSVLWVGEMLVNGLLVGLAPGAIWDVDYLTLALGVDVRVLVLHSGQWSDRRREAVPVDKGFFDLMFEIVTTLDRSS